jgi:hypothetical protein
VRLVVLLSLVVGAWLVLRRREHDERRVVLAWEDGSELEFSRGSSERESLVAIAREAVT